MTWCNGGSPEYQPMALVNGVCGPPYSPAIGVIQSQQYAVGGTNGPCGDYIHVNRLEAGLPAGLYNLWTD